MKGVSPPLRFLVLLLSGWTGIRIAMIGGSAVLPAEADQESRKARVALPRLIPKAAASPFGSQPVGRFSSATVAAEPQWIDYRARPAWENPAAAVGAAMSEGMGPDARASFFAVAAREQKGASVPFVTPPPSMPAVPNQLSPLAPPSSRSGNRLSAEAWALVRRGEGASLAAGGVLGGSQAGGRILYRVGGSAAAPLSLSVRAYAPLESLRGAEASAGIVAACRGAADPNPRRAPSGRRQGRPLRIRFARAWRRQPRAPRRAGGCRRLWASRRRRRQPARCIRRRIGGRRRHRRRSPPSSRRPWPLGGGTDGRRAARCRSANIRADRSGGSVVPPRGRLSGEGGGKCRARLWAGAHALHSFLTARSRPACLDGGRV